MWFAIVGKRTAHGTTALTRSPLAKPLSLEDEHLVVADPDRLAQLGLRTRLQMLDPAGVTDLAAAGRIEG